jgi:hypothetical protein
MCNVIYQGLSTSCEASGATREAVAANGAMATRGYLSVQTSMPRIVRSDE